MDNRLAYFSTNQPDVIRGGDDTLLASARCRRRARRSFSNPPVASLLCHLVARDSHDDDAPAVAAMRRPYIGDTSESDISDDDDVSDAEDAALRRRVRERAAEPPARSGAPTPAPAPARAADDDERAVLCGDASAPNAAPRRVQGVNTGRVGPELAKLRAAQGEHAEYYTLEHYHRLYGWRRPWGRDHRPSKTWCKDVHPPGCTECTSCHFCRQKTTVKTRCACGEWRRAPRRTRPRHGAATASRCTWART